MRSRTSRDLDISFVLQRLERTENIAVKSITEGTLGALEKSLIIFGKLNHLRIAHPPFRLFDRNGFLLRVEVVIFLGVVVVVEVIVVEVIIFEVIIFEVVVKVLVFLFVAVEVVVLVFLGNWSGGKTAHGLVGAVDFVLAILSYIFQSISRSKSFP